MGNVVIATLPGIRWGALRRPTLSGFAVLVAVVVFAGAIGWAGSIAGADGYDSAELRYDGQPDGASRILADLTQEDARDGSRPDVVSPTIGVAGTSPHLTRSPSAPSGLADDFANHGGEFVDDAIRSPVVRPDIAGVTSKIQNDMVRRGWTPLMVDDALPGALTGHSLAECLGTKVSHR